MAIFAWVEMPRGELFYDVRGRKFKVLDSVKIRTSTYTNGPGTVPLITSLSWRTSS